MNALQYNWVLIAVAGEWIRNCLYKYVSLSGAGTQPVASCSECLYSLLKIRNKFSEKKFNRVLNVPSNFHYNQTTRLCFQSNKKFSF